MSQTRIGKILEQYRMSEDELENYEYFIVYKETVDPCEDSYEPFESVVDAVEEIKRLGIDKNKIEILGCDSSLDLTRSGQVLADRRSPKTYIYDYRGTLIKPINKM